MKRFINYSKDILPMKRRYGMSLILTLLFLAITTGSYAKEADLHNSNARLFNVGLKVVDFEYKRENRSPEIVTTAIWYPTEAKPKKFKFKSGIVMRKSKVARDADIANTGKAYPLIIFSHGGFGSSFDTAYFMEHLAKHGYIVVAPEYPDRGPPDYKERLSYARAGKGQVFRVRKLKKAIKAFAHEMRDRRDFYLLYLWENRFSHTSFIIDKMQELNHDNGSIFHGMIDENAIGACGHSQGGLTTLGKTGGHPYAKFKDDRIKASLLFASSVYPLEATLKNISVPTMLMAGEHDDKPEVFPELSRRTIYDKVKPPKYYLVLKGANHLTFLNIRSGKLRIRRKQKHFNTINRYGVLFFDRFVRKDLSVNNQLLKGDKNLCYYVMEEKEDEPVVIVPECPK